MTSSTLSPRRQQSGSTSRYFPVLLLNLPPQRHLTTHPTGPKNDHRRQDLPSKSLRHSTHLLFPVVANDPPANPPPRPAKSASAPSPPASTAARTASSSCTTSPTERRSFPWSGGSSRPKPTPPRTLRCIWYASPPPHTTNLPTTEILTKRNKQVGTKLDKASQGREVSTEEGRALAEAHGALFSEVSSLTRQNVRKPFVDVINQIMQTPELAASIRGGRPPGTVTVGGGGDVGGWGCAC